MDRKRKAKTHKGRRHLEAQEPTLLEPVKTAMFVKGAGCSAGVQQLLRDLAQLRCFHAQRYSRRNDVRPFESSASLEFFAQRTDAALFAVGTHNKKRPHGLVLGRTFSHQLLDMAEFGVLNLRSAAEFKSKLSLGSAPLLVFQGEEWKSSEEWRRTHNLLLDFFSQTSDRTATLSLAGVEYCMVFSAVAGVVHVRVYALILKKAEGRTPYVELLEVGPHFDLVRRRTAWASPDMEKDARVRPRKPRLDKNVEYRGAGEHVGRIHLGRQDLDALAQSVRLPKALRSSGKRSADSDATASPSARKRVNASE